MNNLANNQEWVLDKLLVKLHVEQEKLTIQVINQQTKDVWCSGDITETEAIDITHKMLSNNPLSQLKSLIKDAFNQLNGVSYKFAFEVSCCSKIEIIYRLQNSNETLLLTISITFYLETKNFVVSLLKKEMDSNWKVSQILSDIRNDLENNTLAMQKENAALKNELQQLKSDFQKLATEFHAISMSQSMKCQHTF